MQTFVRVVRSLSQFFGYIAAGLIGLGVLVVCHMVFVRYALGHNTIWQTDFVTYSLVAATFIGSPYVLMTRGHVNVDVLPLYAGPRVRFWLAMFPGSGTLALALGLAVLTFLFWKQAWDNSWVSDTMWRGGLGVPHPSSPDGAQVAALE